mmetsp:Transcript_1292/g.2745  ORF Transcript_1292/g.2745 Transcript_1292/m.2745 type:complete len:255 (-) Transcript_1292:8-772(-)
MVTLSWPHLLLLALLVSPSCGTKYLLFTTQRSGSTWLCDVLNRQSGVACGVPKSHSDPDHSSLVSEMMIAYSFLRTHAVVKGFEGYDYSNITWARWRADFEAQFARLAEQGRNGTVAIGFKLMYDQVPPRLVIPFVEYLARENIIVIHLEREAVLLTMASRYDLQQEPARPHSTNSTSAARLRESTPLLNISFDRLKNDIEEMIATHIEWKTRLRYAPGVRYFHIGYEQLVGPVAENYLRSIVAFVLESGVDVA